MQLGCIYKIINLILPHQFFQFKVEKLVDRQRLRVVPESHLLEYPHEEIPPVDLFFIPADFSCFWASTRSGSLGIICQNQVCRKIE